MEKIYEGCGIIAFRTERAIEVWSDDGDQCYGDVPINTTIETIDSVGKIIQNAFNLGIKTAVNEMRNQARAWLGI